LEVIICIAWISSGLSCKSASIVMITSPWLYKTSM
jgi:hypothetical protein